MTIDASLDDTVSPAARRGPWLFWGTTLWGLAIIVAAMASAVAGVFAGFVWITPDPDLLEAEALQLLLSHGGILFAICGACAATAAAVLALAIRLSGLPIRDYLGLTLPRRSDLMIGLAGLAAMYVAFAVANDLSGGPRIHPWVADLYRQAQSSGHLALMLAAVVILAPVSEELLVRGFLQRGWSASRLGVVGAIVLTAAFWAGLHTQYNLPIIVYIFCVGLLLGWLRHRSGSTLLTMLLHAIQNAASMIHVAIYYWLALGA